MAVSKVETGLVRRRDGKSGRKEAGRVYLFDSAFSWSFPAIYSSDLTKCALVPTSPSSRASLSVAAPLVKCECGGWVVASSARIKRWRGSALA